MAKSAKSGARAAVALICFLYLAPSAHAANVLVPTLELVTRGFSSNNVFELATFGQMDLVFDGGMKFGGKIAFTYLNDFLEENPLGASLAFKGLSITLQDIFSLPLSFSWFIGRNDLLCEGDAFTTVFGSPPLMTRYRGYMYFPLSVIYDGIHQIVGTGFRIDFTPVKEIFLFSLYGYEDTNFTTDTPQIDGTVLTLLSPGYYSADLRMLADFSIVKLEAFIGWTYSPTAALGYYRGGILFYAAGGDTVEFLAQVGLPKFDPSTDPNFTINLFYLLFEPRLHLGIFSIVPTFFWHPGYYLQKTTGETGSFDVNLDLYLGDLSETGLRGGLESTFKFGSSTGTFEFSESPYFSFVILGIEWNLKVSLKLDFPLTASDLSALIGIRAEF